MARSNALMPVSMLARWWSSVRSMGNSTESNDDTIALPDVPTAQEPVQEILSRGAKRYLATVEYAAVAIMVLAFTTSPSVTIGSGLLAVSLAGAMGLAGLSPLRIGHRGKLCLDTAALVAAVLLFPVAIAVAIGAVGRVVALRCNRQTWEEIKFNTAIVVVQAGIGGALLDLVGWSPAFVLRNDVWLLVAIAVGSLIWLINPLLVAPIVAFQGNVSLIDGWKALLAPFGRVELLLDISQIGIGVLVAEVALAYRWQVAVLLLPAGVLYQALAYHVRLRQRAEQRLKHQAFHDPLTDLPNRALFLQQLEQELTTSDRVALLFIDLDRFKFVNDSLGHVVGDEMLVRVSRRLEGNVPNGSLVARFGGDEFTVMLAGHDDQPSPEAIAIGIAEALDTPFSINGHDAVVTASIGIALAGPGARSASDLLRDADVALYRAKKDGKSRYAVYDADVDRGARQKVTMELDLRRAVSDNEFFLVFQPQITLASGRLAAVEALLRWRHPTRGVISPVSFIPLAEETDLILPMGRWVLHEACVQGRAWADQHEHPLTVSVNLSARQFQSPDLLADVRSALKTSGLDPALLKLEITESAMMVEPEDPKVLLRLKALGVQIAIDDFGTGYASLDYLRRFPLDEIKIDRTFVAGLGRDGGAATIVRAVVGLAHALGLAVVAEGVETGAQVMRLRELGCELGQGYFFHRPVAASDIDSLLERQSPRTGSRDTIQLVNPAYSEAV